MDASTPGRPPSAGDGAIEVSWRIALWGQFGAAIDMLENAVHACPDELWADRSRQPEFWYLVYHTLFWLDLYLYGAVEGFTPPAPFGLEELDPAGILPDRTYEKEELLRFLQHGREKCRTTIDSMTTERAARRCRLRWGEVDFLELLLYNLRHVQHHAGQLNLILRQRTDSAPGWLGRSRGLPTHTNPRPGDPADARPPG